MLVVHGGISDSTDLDLIRSLDRGKYVSLLRPPILENAVPGAEVIDKVEWKQVRKWNTLKVVKKFKSILYKLAPWGVKSLPPDLRIHMFQSD